MFESSKIVHDERRAYRIFLVSLTLIILILFSGIFLGVALRNTTLVKDVIVERARGLFQQIVLTRRWAAGYGGVYVKKGPGVESNPWLIHPDLEAADGAMLTLRNPALITREISEIADRQEGYRFRITSLKPLNPGNAADDFEHRSLQSFETGQTEAWETIDGSEGKEFRYMGALKTEASCLVCHAVQGYKEGDIRGGISVSFEVDSIERELARNVAFIIIAALAVTALTLAMVFKFVLRLRHELDRVREELVRAASTDTLTGLFNRGFIMNRMKQETEKAVRTGSDLTCAILDADDFKSVNDTDGHPAGDLALKMIADALQSNARAYDIVGRYGGEEFLVVFPGESTQAALAACERMRASISKATAAVMPHGRTVTVSIGLADLSSIRASPVTAADKHDQKSGRNSELVETLLRNSDAALYQAKAAGKNCCTVFVKEA
jgi:diguanylate cyclase (GGDEF)-like protein